MTFAPNRRWLRFGVRTMFVVVTVFGIVAGWIAWNAQIVHERNNMRYIIRRNGGYVLLNDTVEFPLDANGNEIPNSSFLDISYDEVQVSLLRRMLGDEGVKLIQVRRQSEVKIAKRIFPECIVYVDRLPLNNPILNNP